MALYAFDGTGNEDNEEDGEDTSVVKFSEAHKEGPNSANDFYVAGVGTRFGWLGMILGGAFGAGGQERVNEGMEQLEANNPPRGLAVVDDGGVTSRAFEV